MDILHHNREAWSKLVEESNIWTRPVDSRVTDEAKRGNWSIVLTPTKPVPSDWFPPLDGKKVLCLASGGGQQGPVLAAAGADVTVFDNCPSQLERDTMVAKRDNLSIKVEQGDMRDLSRFNDESFDLVFHPVSNCFMDDVKKVWRECYRVLKKSGSLLAGFCNPVTFIFDMQDWDEQQKLSVKHRIPYSDLEQLSADQLKAKIEKREPLEYGHSLQDQIGGQLDAGFLIAGFYEDSAGGDLLDPHIDTFIATRAIKSTR